MGSMFGQNKKDEVIADLALWIFRLGKLAFHSAFVCLGGAG